MTAVIIDNLLQEFKRGMLILILHIESYSAIKDSVCQLAILVVPIHAEIQLPFHY